MGDNKTKKKQQYHPERNTDSARFSNFLRQTGLGAKQPGSAKARRARDQKKGRR